jgi:hypothetical protein
MTLSKHRVRTLDPRSMQSVALIFVLDHHKNVFRVVMMLLAPIRHFFRAARPASLTTVGNGAVP